MYILLDLTQSGNVEVVLQQVSHTVHNKSCLLEALFHLRERKKYLILSLTFFDSGKCYQYISMEISSL